MALAIGVVSLLGALAAIFLKFYPAWKGTNDEYAAKNKAEQFGNHLIDGDNLGASALLSELFDRVRSKNRDNTK